MPGDGTVRGLGRHGSRPGAGGCPGWPCGPDVSAERHRRGAGREERPVKYMILTYASQQDYDGLAGRPSSGGTAWSRSEEHTSELQSHLNLVCRLLLEKKKK